MRETHIQQQQLGSSTAMEEPSPAYERPRLVLIGNLNDLLAGNASKFPDLGACTGAAGTVTVDPMC
jgi:hypothetical protein